MKDTSFTVFNVGQGLFTLICGSRSMDNEPYVGIFDCGSIAYHPHVSKEQLIQEIDGLIQHIQSNNAAIDDIVISHQDNDHWSLLSEIISRYLGIDEAQQWHQKNIFLCRWDNSSATMFCREDEDLFSYYYVFESEKCTQSLEYELDVSNIYHTFCYHGVFTDTDITWDFEILASAEENVISVTVMSNQMKEDEVFEEQEEMCVGPLLMHELMETLSKQVQQHLKEKKCDTMYTAKHLNEMKKTVRNNLCSYEMIRVVLEDLEELPQQRKIKHVFWGGAQPSAKCRIMQKALLQLENAGVILQIRFLPEGGCIEILDGKSFCYDDEMSCKNYNKDLQCANGEGIDILSIQRNVTSAVTYVELLPAVRCLLPGDLTVHGFESLSEIILGYVKMYHLSILVAPHHGSPHTNFCSKQGHKPLTELLEAFMGREHTQSAGAVVSALACKFGHPGSAFIESVKPYCSGGEPLHYICTGDGKRCNPSEEPTDLFLYCTETLDETAFYRYFNEQEAYMAAGKAEHADFTARQPRKTPSRRLFL